MASTGVGFRQIQVLALSGLIAWTLAPFEPIQLAVQNWDEIGVDVSDLLSGYWLPFVVVFGAVATLGWISSLLAPRRSVAVLVALYALLWAQGNLFVWDYGAFDGSPIDWGRHRGKAILEVCVWGGAIGLALAKPDWLTRRALRFAALICALQLASLGGQLVRHAPLSRRAERQTFPIESLSRYSRTLNAIIVVLDSLQSDVFSEAMDDPALRAEMPPGFTNYRNAVSLYTETNFSLQSILTSKAVPDRSQPSAWIEEQMTSSLPAVLARRGFDSALVTFADAAIRCSGVSHGYRCIRASLLAEPAAYAADAAWREDMSDLFSLGLFRLAPHFVKPRIYDHGRWRIRGLYPVHIRPRLNPQIHRSSRRDLAVFDELIRSASADDGVPRFRFFHFFAAHFPNTIDAHCGLQHRVARNYVARLRQNAVEASRCVLAKLFQLLNRLDEIGVYDQSLIFVVADHGQMFFPVVPAAASQPLPARTAPRAGADGPTLQQPQRGVALFLVKPLAERGPLRISDVPVSLCDVPRSVLDALGIDGDFGCESVFGPPDGDRQPRFHYRYPYYSERLQLSHDWDWREFSFQKFDVDGHSWYTESWIPIEPGRYDDTPWIEGSQ